MKTTIQYIKRELAGLYSPTEIEGLVRILLESICGWGFTEQVVKRNETISAIDFEKIESIVARLKLAEPIQYILGETEFYGLKLKVNPSVLIPRPETEELVDWIANIKLPENCRVLDIGTGSGCIALAVKNQLKEAKVSGIDISENAIETARQNAIENKIEVDFFQADILNYNNIKAEKYDVIVSNPPYIRNSEKNKMHSNVLNFEPEIALFVKDDDPLVFYSAIAAFARKGLTTDGYLFFEINENLGNEMLEMLGGFGFQNIIIRKDINGKSRMVQCKNNI
jgi:release factor glutamine methyltransferase